MRHRHLRFWVGLKILASILLCPISVQAAELQIPDDLSRPEPSLPEPSSPEPETPNSENEAVETEPRPYEPLRITTACPEEPAALSELMVRDLPNYANRVLQRTVAVLPWTEADELRAAEGEVVRSPYRPSHVLTAGNVNLEPVDLNDYAFTTDPAAGGPLTQLFFTTLSRQYYRLRFEQVQEYHWLFLTQTTDGWRLAFMFSAVDNANDVRAALPPRENSTGTIGQAVKLWLRDCRAGAIEAVEADIER